MVSIFPGITLLAVTLRLEGLRLPSGAPELKPAGATSLVRAPEDLWLLDVSAACPGYNVKQVEVASLLDAQKERI